MFCHRPSATIFPHLIAVLGAYRKCVLNHLGMHLFSRLVHNFFSAPGKKRIFFLRKGLSWPRLSFPVVCVVWSHRAALLAYQLGAGINFAFYSFVGAKHIYIFTKKKGCVFDERFFFLIRKEPLHFFYQRLLGAYSAVIQRMSRGQLLQVCGRYFDDNWEATGTGRSWAAGMSSEKRLQAILRIENNFEGIYSSSQELKPITRNWMFLLHC